MDGSAWPHQHRRLGLGVGSALLVLLLLTASCSARNTHEFPAGGDELRAILGEAFTPYVVDGCIHGTSGTTSAPMPTCRGYANDPGPPRQWQYFAETAERTITYNAGNGTYWLIAHTTLTEVVAGWTRVAGTHYLWQLSATRPVIPEDAILLQQSTVAGGAITVVGSEAPRWVVPQTITADTTTSATAPWIWTGRGAVVTVAVAKTLTLGTCPNAGRYPIFAADGVTTGVVRFASGACGQVFPEWWGTSPTTFQQATDALTAWGGVIDLAQGQYTQNTVTAKHRAVLRGKGVGATTWKLADNTNTWGYGGPHTNSALIANDDVMDCGIHDMTLDGNASMNTESCAGCGFIAPRGFTRCHFSNLHITNTDRDSIGGIGRTQDSTFTNILMDTNGRACVGITGGSLRNTFRDLTCISPFTSCWDSEGADGVPALWDADYSFNLLDGLTCITPNSAGVATTFGANIAAGFTGTREGNRFSNISIIQPGGAGLLIADINNTTITNVSVQGAAQTDPNAHGIWIGGYSTLGTRGVTLTGCSILDTGGTSYGLFLGDGDAPGVVSHVSVSGCVIANSAGAADLRIDNIQYVNLSGVEARTLSIAGGALPINIASSGQGEALPSAVHLTPRGLHNNYLVTGTTGINEVNKASLWMGRTLTFTFDSNIVVRHNNDSTDVPIYLANESNVTFCAGDTLTLRYTDVTSGENRLQETGRSRALSLVTHSTGTTPSVACATNHFLAMAAPTSVTDFETAETGVVYSFYCSGTNTTLVDISSGGNFNLLGNNPFSCTGSDVIRLVKLTGGTEWLEVGRSVN